MLYFRAGLWYRFSGTGFRRRFLVCVMGVVAQCRASDSQSPGGRVHSHFGYCCQQHSASCSRSFLLTYLLVPLIPTSTIWRQFENHEGNNSLWKRCNRPLIALDISSLLSHDPQTELSAMSVFLK